MHIIFAVKIVRLKLYMTIASPMALTWIKVTNASQTWPFFNFQYLGQVYFFYIQTWHSENTEVNSLRNLAMFIFYALKLREELIIERNNKQNS